MVALYTGTVTLRSRRVPYRLLWSAGCIVNPEVNQMRRRADQYREVGLALATNRRPGLIIGVTTRVYHSELHELSKLRPDRRSWTCRLFDVAAAQFRQNRSSRVIQFVRR